MKNSKFSTSYTLLLIAFSFILTTIISLYSLNRVIQNNNFDIAQILCTEIYGEINSAFTESITICQSISNNTLLADRIKNADQQSIDLFLHANIDHERYHSATIYSLKDGKCYSSDSNLTESFFIEPSTEWLSTFIQSADPYMFYIDKNENTTHSGIMILYKLQDTDSSVYGIFCLEINLSTIQEAIQYLEEEHDVSIMIEDQDQNIILNDTLINLENIQATLSSNPIASETIYKKLPNGGYRIQRYIEPLNAYLLIIKSHSNIYSIFAELIIANLFALVIIAVVLLLLVNHFMKLGNRASAENARMCAFQNFGNIYLSSYLISIQEDSYEIINESVNLKEIVPKNSLATVFLDQLCKNYADPSHQEGLSVFLDLSTVAKRLSYTGTISYEFMNTQSSWLRIRYIAVSDFCNTLQVILAIENIDEEKKRENKLLYLSETDLMTGIRNRGSGERKISELISSKTPGIFCLMDADKFKSINDTYGHDVGDKVIISIARCLKESFRDNDIVLRLGGDEFAAYAVQITDYMVAITIIERFLKNIQKIRIEELGDRQLSISLGVSFYDGVSTITFEELYKRADSVLYESKKITGCSYTVYGK